MHIDIFHINFSSSSRLITSSLSHFFNSYNFSSVVIVCDAIVVFINVELISGRSTYATLLSGGNFPCKNAYPCLLKIIKAFY